MPMSSCYGLLVAWQATLEALCMREVLEDRHGYICTYVCVCAYWCVCVEGVCVYIRAYTCEDVC